MITDRLPDQLKKYFVEELMTLVKKYNRFEEYEVEEIEDVLKLRAKFEVDLNGDNIDYLFKIVKMY